MGGFRTGFFGFGVLGLAAEDAAGAALELATGAPASSTDVALALPAVAALASGEATSCSPKPVDDIDDGVLVATVAEASGWLDSPS